MILLHLCIRHSRDKRERTVMGAVLSFFVLGDISNCANNTGGRYFREYIINSAMNNNRFLSSVFKKREDDSKIAKNRQC